LPDGGFVTAVRIHQIGILFRPIFCPWSPTFLCRLDDHVRKYRNKTAVLLNFGRIIGVHCTVIEQIVSNREAGGRGIERVILRDIERYRERYRRTPYTKGREK